MGRRGTSAKASRDVWLIKSVGQENELREQHRILRIFSDAASLCLRQRVCTSHRLSYDVSRMQQARHPSVGPTRQNMMKTDRTSELCAHGHLCLRIGFEDLTNPLGRAMHVGLPMKVVSMVAWTFLVRRVHAGHPDDGLSRCRSSIRAAWSDVFLSSPDRAK